MLGRYKVNEKINLKDIYDLILEIKEQGKDINEIDVVLGIGDRLDGFYLDISEIRNDLLILKH